MKRAPGDVRQTAAAALYAALLLVAVPSFSQDVTFSVRTSTGILIGTANELVLDTGYVVSRLDWALQPVLYVGSVLDMKTAIGFSASLSVRSGLPGFSGYITDSDYLNGDGVLTHFSKHNCYTEQALLVDARFGWRFPLIEALVLEPFLDFSAMHFKWTARDGYVQYPPEPWPGPYTPWTPGREQIPAYGTGIIYQQTYLIPALGVDVSYRLTVAIDASFSFLFSPYVVCNDLDNHELRQLDFYENMGAGLLFEPALGLDLRFAPRATASFQVFYRIITGLIGDSYEIQTGIGAGASLGPIPNSGGAGFNAFGASLSLTLTL